MSGALLHAECVPKKIINFHIIAGNEEQEVPTCLVRASQGWRSRTELIPLHNPIPKLLAIHPRPQPRRQQKCSAQFPASRSIPA